MGDLMAPMGAVSAGTEHFLCAGRGVTNRGARPQVIRARFVLAFLPFALAACAAAGPAASGAAVPADVGVPVESAPPIRFVREELYFGANRRGRAPVTDAEWAVFLREVATPQFPEGLTVLAGRGQYRLQDGAIIEEGMHLLVLLYEQDAATAAAKDSAIREIVRHYKERFDQESVLRVTSLVVAAL